MKNVYVKFPYYTRLLTTWSLLIVRHLILAIFVAFTGKSINDDETRMAVVITEFSYN
jgi:hypothetical protein